MENSMNDDKNLVFRLKDEVNGEEVNLENISLPLLIEFAEQVTRFLKGDKRINLNSVKTNLRSGSVVIEVENKTGIFDEAFEDYEIAKTLGDLGRINPVRAKVLQEWQEESRKNPDRIYDIIGDAFDESAEKDEDITWLRIDQDTDFNKPKEHWVQIEKYVYGRVNDLGGKTSANVHIEVLGHGTVKVSTDAKKLFEDKSNRIYKKQLLRIKAEENIVTHEWRNERLISFENYEPSYDKDEHEKLVSKSTKIWGDILDSSLWVETLRGNA